MISANGYLGIWITGSGTSNNLVQGNYIGTDATSTVGLGNASRHPDRQRRLVQRHRRLQRNDLNIIVYNASNGVGIGSGSFGNMIEVDMIDLNGANGVYFRRGFG